MSMSVGERDKKMSELASEAASEFLHKYEIGDKQIKSSPETFLQYSIPYLTVRALHRQEKALKSLEADSRWIKRLTIRVSDPDHCSSVLCFPFGYGFTLTIAVTDALQRTAPRY
jgi:hypothetical protein